MINCLNGRIQKLGFLLAFSVVATMLSPCASADGLEDARRRGRFLAGIKTDFAPFGSVDQNHVYRGFDVDIARYLALSFLDDENRVSFVEITSGSRIPFLYSRWIDLIIATMTVTDTRLRVLEFSDPYFLSGSLILVPKASAISGLESISGKRVAVIAGSVQESDLKQVAPQASQIAFETVHNAIQALKKGSVDAFCQDDVLLLNLARNDSQLKVVGKPFIQRPYAIAVRKGETEFIQWVNRQLARMRQDGTYDALWSKHFGDIEEHLIKP